MILSYWNWLRWKIRELLDQYEFPGDDTPIIIGSALKALEGDTSDIGMPAVQKLIETLDEYIPEPERAIDQSFLMPDRRRFLDFWSWNGCDWSY